jgi:Iap family predicted aminopeptidase
MRRLPLLLVGVCLVFLLIPTSAFATPSFDQAVDQLVAQGYPQRLEAQLDSYGTSPLGFRLGGTTADNAAAQYLADEMKRIGLVNVKLEKVPVDVWTFRGASVAVAGRTLTATSFGGVPPTPFGGATGELVYAGLGSAPELDALGDVSGEIVLVDFASDYWWLNLPGLEAKLRGAKAVIMTYNPHYPYYYGVAPDALGSNDGCYDWDASPMVYVSQNDGDWLKSQIAAGDTSATVVNDVTMEFADNGGRGYNVIGQLPGSDKDRAMVVYSAHHDAYFRMGLDDTASVVADLMVAKAMRMSGCTPVRTQTFFFTTSEEWGFTNCYYDWCAGAWQAIDRTHPDWPGNIAGWIEGELLGYKSGSLWMTATPEMKPYLDATAAANRKVVGQTGGQVYNPDESVWFTYNDQRPMTSKGIPSVCLWTTKDPFWATIYHTDYDNQSQVDFAYLGDNAKFIFRIGQGLDSGLLPYSLKARADHLAGTASATALKAAGADATVVDRYANAVTSFQRAADAYEARMSTISSARWPDVNAALLGIEVEVNKAFTGLGCWDETLYPHQQTLADTQYLNSAISALEKPNPQDAAAFKALEAVGATWYGEFFSYPVYLRERARRDPAHPRLSWAAAGHIPMFVDVMPEWHQIEAGDYASAVAGLKQVRDAEVGDLNTRLVAMTETLEKATPRMDDLR